MLVIVAEREGSHFEIGERVCYYDWVPLNVGCGSNCLDAAYMEVWASFILFHATKVSIMSFLRQTKRH